MDQFSSNLRWTYYKLHQVAWVTYFSCSLTARMPASAGVRACALLKHLIFGRILFKFAVHILQIITSYMSYILMFTHRGHARKCVCPSARVIKYSLIYGQFLFKCAVNILQITTISKDYVLFLFTHRAHAWFNIQLSLDGFSSNLMGTYYKWPQVTWDTYLSCSSTACTRVCECACASVRVRVRAWLSTRSSSNGFSKFRGDIQHIPRVYMSYLIWVWTHVITALISIHSRICQVCDGQWIVTLKYADVCMR
jgi:hypothetical protein